MTDKITIERETLEQAMSVLHEISPHTFPGVTLWRRVSASIAAIDDALSAALAAQAKAGDEARAELARLRAVEPIGWYDSESGKTVFGVKPASKPWSPSAQWLPFFAAPPAQPAEPTTHDPAIRWNFGASDTHLLVCREDHDKGDKCEYKQLHPSEVLAIVNRLRISAIELTFRSAAQPAPAAVPLTDEKIDHTLATTLDEFARTTRGMSHALDVNADITANSRLRRMFARAVLAAAGDKP